MSCTNALPAVDLRNRRRSERVGIQAHEEVRIELLVDHTLDRRERHGRHVVDEPTQLLHVRIGQQVGPGGEELPELDVRRAEILERKAELTCALLRCRTLADDADLAQCPEELAAPRDSDDVQRPSQPLRARAHRATFYRISRR
jgi:hypothetical protein